MSVADAMVALDELLAPTHEWADDETPTAPGAVERAKTFVHVAHDAGLRIEDVDADVCGGVALFVGNGTERTVWLSIMNEGRDSFVVLDGWKATLSGSLAGVPMRDVAEWLKN